MSQPSLSRLPRVLHHARQLIHDNIMGIDRLKFWLDDPEPHLPAELMKRRVDPRKRRNDKTKYHPKWQSKFDLFQPDADNLRAFEEAIGTRYSVKLSEVELNMDWITRTDEEAMELRDFALAHMRVPYWKEPVKIKERTAYFRRLDDGNGNKQLRNLVIYADNLDKRTGRPCCHIEWRFCGPAPLGDIGLFTLDDCATFDHRDFWSRHLDLFALPPKAAISHWLDGESAISGTAHRKRADRFLEQYRQDGAFVLQNCRLNNPKISTILTPVDNALFLPE
jgi:hypothetical protein